MKVSEYIAQYLQGRGVTDVFGIPGGVVLDLMYALDATEGITPHLSYHEQCAGFAACGYAQVEGRLGVAYATKGPGFTNLLTAMADAYYDSIPVLFLTAHSAATLPDGCRLVADQDMDTCGMVKRMTKYAQRIDNLETLPKALVDACCIAMEGRKGPVFLDIAASLFKQEMPSSVVEQTALEPSDSVEEMTEWISQEIRQAKRPVILIGDGINQSHTVGMMNAFAKKAGVPVISSRYSHNVLKDESMYFGYVGSHGIRYANFILSKADLVLSLGNRLYFPSQSLSYGKIVKQAKFLRFDIDEGELRKHPQMQAGRQVDMNSLVPALASKESAYGNHREWLDVCRTLKGKLKNEDVNETVLILSKLLQSLPKDCVIVNDVGNNEFWMSRACVYAGITNRTLYSKSFGALGNALGKAIGAYYATKKPIAVFVGDQGIQLNIQELQYISQHKLPIAIVLLNNVSSGMIKDREAMAGYDYSLHTTKDSGYRTPKFSIIALAYGIKYVQADENSSLAAIDRPIFMELSIPENQTLTPSLPRGRDMQDLEPRINIELYNRLNAL